MKRIIFITSIIVFTIFLLNSCGYSEMKNITITKDQELIFSESGYGKFYDIIIINIS